MMRSKYTIKMLFVATTLVSLLCASSMWATRDLRRAWRLEQQLRDVGAVYAEVDRSNWTAKVVFNTVPTSLDVDITDFDGIEFQQAILDDQTVKSVSSATTLKQLIFSRCDFQESSCLESIRNMPIHYLTFWECQPNSKMIETLSKMQNVKQLTLRNSGLDPAIVESIKNANPNLKVVQVEKP